MECFAIGVAKRLRNKFVRERNFKSLISLGSRNQVFRGFEQFQCFSLKFPWRGDFLDPKLALCQASCADPRPMLGQGSPLFHRPLTIFDKRENVTKLVIIPDLTDKSTAFTGSNGLSDRCEKGFGAGESR
jgi:hypothetical protein